MATSRPRQRNDRLTAETAQMRPYAPGPYARSGSDRSARANKRNRVARFPPLACGRILFSGASRDSRGLRTLRGWSHEHDDEIFAGSPKRAVRLGAGAPVIPRSGRQWGRLPGRSAARRRPCASGYANTNVTRDSGAGLTRDERQRLKALERENRKLCRTNEILRKASVS